jgi:hypothetical protein
MKQEKQEKQEKSEKPETKKKRRPHSSKPDRRDAIKEAKKEGKLLKDKFGVKFEEEENQEEPLAEIMSEEEFNANIEMEYKKGLSKKDYIVSLFPRRLLAELYFAWCKDCNENITAENAKYFRDELLMRGNKDNKMFNFRSLRVSKNFIIAFVGNLESGQIEKLDLSDNLITDICMYNLTNIITARKVMHLNLASNMISTEGLKIIQNELILSDSLRYLNVRNIG